MDTIFLKIKIKKNNHTTDEIRNEGCLFSSIANSISVDREDIIEIDEANYQATIQQIKNKFSIHDKGRGNKKSIRRP
jgi:hypothetical protein